MAGDHIAVRIDIARREREHTIYHEMAHFFTHGPAGPLSLLGGS